MTSIKEDFCRNGCEATAGFQLGNKRRVLSSAVAHLILVRPMKTLQRLAIILCAVALASAAGWALLQHPAVPYRGRQPAAFSPIWRGDGYTKVPPDAKILRLVAAAQRDFFISPIPGIPRWHLTFDNARVRGREVYLLFGSDVSDTVVVYCVTPEDGRLHWKMDLGLDA